MIFSKRTYWASVVATLRRGNAEIGIYEGTSSVVEVLCKVVRNAE